MPARTPTTALWGKVGADAVKRPASSVSRCQLGDRLHAEFRRDGRTVQLHRPLMNAEIAGDLFVQLAAHDMAEHLEFPAA